jgi:hypothetical protein
MYRHVPLELIRAWKALAAPRMRTRKGPFARMRADVFREVGRFHKALAAVGAYERFFAIMRALYLSALLVYPPHA